MKRTLLSVTVNDTPGVLQRVSGLFSRRGYNIESITVGASEREGRSRMTVAAWGDEGQIAQMCSQLRKLIDVLEVKRIDERPYLTRELMLVKLRTDGTSRAEIQALVDAFRCSVVDAGIGVIVVQVVGDPEKNDAFVQVVQPYGILEISRTGETAMNRG